MDKFFQKIMPSSPLPPPPVPAPVIPEHPFYPLGLPIANYIANDKSVITMLRDFFSGWVAVLGLTYWMTSRYAPHVKRLDRFIVLWFVLSGCIHFFFEGYFAINHTRMGPSMDLFGQLWKEYARSDSRYLTSDPFVLCMETITAFAWGPLCFLMVYLISADSSLRYPLQAVLSTGQLYGDLLYYATSFFDLYYRGLEYCRPEPYYFWFYFVFMNLIWIVVPAALVYHSAMQTKQAFEALKRMSKSMQGNGVLKGPKAHGHLKKN